MANTRSARQRIKKTKAQAVINRIRKNKYKSAIKQMNVYISTGKISEAKKFLPKFHSQLMKVAKTGSINKRTASRKISRIAKKIKNLKKK